MKILRTYEHGYIINGKRVPTGCTHRLEDVKGWKLAKEGLGKIYLGILLFLMSIWFTGKGLFFFAVGVGEGILSSIVAIPQTICTVSDFVFRLAYATAVTFPGTSVSIGTALLLSISLAISGGTSFSLFPAFAIWSFVGIATITMIDLCSLLAETCFPSGRTTA